MKTKLLLLAVIGLLASVLCFAEPITLSPNDLPELVACLKSLDGQWKAVDQGPGNPARIIVEPYKFSGDVRSRLAADLVVLDKTVHGYGERLDAKRAEAAGLGATFDENNLAHKAAFARLSAPILKEEVKLELSPISTADLQLDQNAIPVSVLAVLAKLRPPAAK